MVYISSASTDREIMADLGARLRALRKSRRLTLKEVASATDLARRTVARAEKGDNPQLETLLKLLRVYGRLEALDGFIPEPELSPMALLAERRQKRSRPSKGRPSESRPSESRSSERHPSGSPPSDSHG